MVNRVCRWRLLAALALLAAGAGSAWAQGLTGQLSGTVVDSSGSVLPGAGVTVKNAGTLVSRDVVTDANGAFVVTELLAGTYDVTWNTRGPSGPVPAGLYFVIFEGGGKRFTHRFAVTR